jgi:AcrR family transcriptional regulator
MRQGLEEVSLRHVAAEAGVSMGMVQHYFASKDEMLLFALDTLNEHVTQRVAERMSVLPDPPSPSALVRTLLLELLPLDEERRADALVGFAFLAQAAVRPKIAGVLRQSFAQLQEFVSEQIRQARDAGDLDTDADPDQEAKALLALTDGLSIHVLAGQRGHEEALVLLDHHLNHVFSPASTLNQSLEG